MYNELVRENDKYRVNSLSRLFSVPRHQSVIFVPDSNHLGTWMFEEDLLEWIFCYSLC